MCGDKLAEGDEEADLEGDGAGYCSETIGWAKGVEG